MMTAAGPSRTPIRSYDSMLGEFADPQCAPEVPGLRETIRSWRFYGHIRTDADAPARRSKIGTRTFVLDHDGADLAAALQAIVEVGDASALDAAIDSAFPGSRLSIARVGSGVLSVQLHQHGLLRPLGVQELSDGTLCYLLWVAALLSPRPASLLVLNEPETSLHGDLLPPAARAGHHRAGQRIWRNCRSWPRATGPAALALAKTLGVHLPPKRRRSHPGTLSDQASTR
jgi:predicted ATPase